MVSIMWANNETGVLFPSKKCPALVKSKGSVFHTDAVQAVGKVPINLQETPIDLLSFSGHKLHAPKGIGVLYIRQRDPVHPFSDRRPPGKRPSGGTENVPYIIGLGKACDLAQTHMTDENQRVRALRDKLEQGIMERHPPGVDQRRPPADVCPTP